MSDLVAKSGRNGRRSAGDRARKFGDLAGRVDFAAIQKQEPQVQQMILQQKQQELMQAQSENQTQAAQLQQEYDQGVKSGLTQKELDEIKTEVDLSLAAGQKLSHEIKSVQEAQITMQNTNAEEHSRRSTPTPGRR